MQRAISAAILVLLLASCTERAEGPVVAEASPAPGPGSAPPHTQAAVFGAVTEEQNAVTIAFSENGEVRELYGDPRETGKRKYTLGGEDPVLYEVKPGGDGGFKLRNADGSLRWKVKIAPDRIRISDNEANDDPFELKVRDDGRVEVVAPGERELGNVRFADGKLQVEDPSGRVVFTHAAQKPSAAYGVLLLDRIPERERFILVAELLSRGR